MLKIRESKEKITDKKISASKDFDPSKWVSEGPLTEAQEKRLKELKEVYDPSKWVR